MTSPKSQNNRGNKNSNNNNKTKKNSNEISTKKHQQKMKEQKQQQHQQQKKQQQHQLNHNDNTDEEFQELPSLPKLLAALALGARSVNNLPLGIERSDGDDDDVNNNNNDDDDDDDEEDEFSFRMSLPEFASLNNEARRSLTELLSRALSSSNEGVGGDGGGDDNNDGGKDDQQNYYYEFDDPLLWEKCADACDALLDRVHAYISSKTSSLSGDENEKQQQEQLTNALTSISNLTRTKSNSTYSQMLSSLADMEKPQNVYQGFVTHPPQNSREEAFVPMIWEEGKRREMVESGRWRVDGHHGLDTRFGVSDKTAKGGGEEDNDYNEYRDGDDVGRRRYAPDMIAPNYHYEHPYREEIENLEYRPWQLEVREVELGGSTLKNSNNNDGTNQVGDGGSGGDDKKGIWIGTEEELETLCNHITQGQENGDIHEIALDLEAHSHRTFAGFVCLIQLSIRRGVAAPTFKDGNNNSSNNNGDNSTTASIQGHDFLIDALSLRHAIPAHLGPILANPSILKVMHGADSDIPWLQRDFGCYVVNLFDTGRASRALKFPSAGLAYLLRKYAGVEADKAHQLSDWRRRPLLEDMRVYAVEDTRYLLDIYDILRKELEDHPSKDVSIEKVLDRSKKVCLIRYDKEPFRPSGYLGIVDGSGRRTIRRGKHEVTSELSPQQEAALKALYDWRDQTARQEDESVQYVCSNAALLRIASNRPVTVAALQRLVNPLPPLVMRRSQEILDAVKMTAVSGASKVANVGGEGTGKEAGKGRSANPTATANKPRSREMLSPILGSDDLYKQAGWITPTGKGSSGVASSESEDEEATRRRLLDVNNSNKGFTSSKYSSHGMEMSPPSLEAEGDNAKRGTSTDGLGTARAALGANDDGTSNTVSDEVNVARKSANLIQREMIKALIGETKDGKYGSGFSLMDFIRPVAEPEDFGLEDNEVADANDNSSSPSKEDNDAEAEDEIAIPKSMREIYKLSNANRRRTNKEKTQKPVQFKDEEMKEDVTMMKGDNVDEAEAIIASRGGAGGYFGSSKRQRTGKLAPGKEGDIELMTKMGWVKGKQDAESLAVTANSNLESSDAEKEKDTANRKKSGKDKDGGGKRGTTDYYANMGAIGAFDPNAMASNNPFFAGAATGAASMFSSDQKQSKPYKKNKKR